MLEWRPCIVNALLANLRPDVLTTLKGLKKNTLLRPWSYDYNGLRLPNIVIESKLNVNKKCQTLIECLSVQQIILVSYRRQMSFLYIYFEIRSMLII